MCISLSFILLTTHYSVIISAHYFSTHARNKKKVLNGVKKKKILFKKASVKVIVNVWINAVIKAIHGRILYCTTRKRRICVGISAWKRVYMIDETKSEILIFINLPSCIVFARHFYVLPLLFRSTTLNISFQTTSKVLHANDTQYTGRCREQDANDHYRMQHK